MQCVRRLLVMIYRALPGMLVSVWGPFFRLRRGQDSGFIDRLSVPYRLAVYGMGEVHWENKVKAFGLTGFGRVLDLGCGPGQWLPHLARHNAGIVGIDVDPSLLEVAGETADLEQRVMLARSRAESLPFRGAVFDAVLCYGVLMYTEWETTLLEISRVLKPGGRLIIGLMGLGYYLKHVIDGLRHERVEAVRYGLGPIVATFGRVLLSRPSHTMIFWTSQAISRVLARHGFDVLRVWGDRYDPMWPTSYAGAYFYFCVEARKRL